MIKGDYEQLDDLAKFNVCSQHHTPLVVAWHSGEKCWVLRCGENHYPDAITRQPSLTGLYRQGEELPGHIEDKVKMGIRRRAMTQGNKSTGIRNWLVPTADLGTGQLLLPEVLQALVDYAHRYNLDPERAHVVIMYGKPYITLDGYLYYAKLQGSPFSLSSRPMTTNELTQHKIGETDFGWVASVVNIESGATVNGIGIVTYDEMTAMSEKKPDQLRSPVVAKHPWQLAQKRAEWQALRRAFPIGEPSEISPEGGA